MLFRNFELVSSILCSIETVYGITAVHMEQLEQCDRLLLKKFSVLFLAWRLKLFTSKENFTFPLYDDRKKINLLLEYLTQNWKWISKTSPTNAAVKMVVGMLGVSVFQTKIVCLSRVGNLESRWILLIITETFSAMERILYSKAHWRWCPLLLS